MCVCVCVCVCVFTDDSLTLCNAFIFHVYQRQHIFKTGVFIIGDKINEKAGMAGQGYLRQGQEQRRSMYTVAPCESAKRSVIV